MRLLTLFAITAIISGTLLLALPSLSPSWTERTRNVFNKAADKTNQEVQDFTNSLTPLTRHISTPAPLRGRLDLTPNITLTTNGVFTATNSHRQDNNLPPLERNSTLDQAAQNKLQDMFDHQYFEHVSPTNVGPGDVVTAVGYNFLTVGENLALGNFDSDTALVQAWMDSPGHRANILGNQFQAIGLAVGQGQFDGQTTWLAVQTFATPASVCTEPNSALKTTIDSTLASKSTLESDLAKKAQIIQSLQSELSLLNNDIKQLQTEGQQLTEEGNAEIREGNRLAQQGQRQQAEPHWEQGEELQRQGQTKLTEAQALVATHNAKIEQIRTLQTEHNQIIDQLRNLEGVLQQQISQYNQQVRAYNTCADQFIG